jgi:ABC-type antimicrobial peptide transport system permease subunit
MTVIAFLVGIFLGFWLANILFYMYINTEIFWEKVSQYLYKEEGKEGLADLVMDLNHKASMYEEVTEDALMAVMNDEDEYILFEPDDEDQEQDKEL